ncbi:aldo/keto reductase, partial [Streptomyces caeruleatus]
SPVVGVTKPAQLADAVAAVDVELDDDEAAYLEEPYQPHETAYLEESFYKSRPVASSR